MLDDWTTRTTVQEHPKIPIHVFYQMLVDDKALVLALAIPRLTRQFFFILSVLCMILFMLAHGGNIGPVAMPPIQWQSDSEDIKSGKGLETWPDG